MVAERNDGALIASRKPVFLIPARHTGRGAKTATTDEAEGLEAELCLMVGAKVMINRNLWTSQGLANGTRGTVQSILFTSSGRPGVDIPAVVMVAVPSYQGPAEHKTEDDIPIIPISAVIVTWEDKTGVRCSRQQIPLQLAYAMTVHKSQGMTLDKVRVDLGESEFSPGLTFVAISRVRRLTGLAFENSMSWRRLEKLKGGKGRGKTREMAEADAVRRGLLPFISW